MEPLRSTHFVFMMMMVCKKSVQLVKIVQLESGNSESIMLKIEKFYMIEYLLLHIKFTLHTLNK